MGKAVDWYGREASSKCILFSMTGDFDFLSEFFSIYNIKNIVISSAAGSFFMLGGWLKTSATTVVRRQKILRLYWLKFPKTNPNPFKVTLD